VVFKNFSIFSSGIINLRVLSPPAPFAVSGCASFSGWGAGAGRRGRGGGGGCGCRWKAQLNRGLSLAVRSQRSTRGSHPSEPHPPSPPVCGSGGATSPFGHEYHLPAVLPHRASLMKPGGQVFRAQGKVHPGSTMRLWGGPGDHPEPDPPCHPEPWTRRGWCGWRASGASGSGLGRLARCTDRRPAPVVALSRLVGEVLAHVAEAVA